MDKEMIHHPEHYNKGTYEVRKVIDAWGLGFDLGNAIKYIARAGKKFKDKEVEDLQKAVQYIQFVYDECDDKQIRHDLENAQHHIQNYINSKEHGGNDGN